MLLKVPFSALRTAENVCVNAKSIRTISVNGLLAADLAMDESKTQRLWRSNLPSIDNFRQSMPLMWPVKLQDSLPQACLSLMEKQKSKIDLDWTAASPILHGVSYEQFMHYWFAVSTRTFYYTSADPYVETPIDAYDCLALVPFADYFNHADAGCKVAYSDSGFEITAHRRIKKGEEVYLSYGNHSNDFLLAEYGFILEDNQWDEIALDERILPLFSAQQKEELRIAGFLGDYILDDNRVCYRTQIALSRLSMPLDQWKILTTNGIDDNDKFASATDDILAGVLRSHLQDVHGRLQQISMLDHTFNHQRELLTKRWEQIGRLLNAALSRLGS